MSKLALSAAFRTSGEVRPLQVILFPRHSQGGEHFLAFGAAVVEVVVVVVEVVEEAVAAVVVDDDVELVVEDGGAWVVAGTVSVPWGWSSSSCRA